MNFYRLLMLVTLSLLTSCTLVPVAQRQVKQGGFEYTICEDGLKVQTKYRAFQGYNGWFYYDYDLEPSYPLMSQTDFMIELGRRLQAQGVRLVIVPVPSRAVVTPQNLYLDDPQQAAFEPAEGVAQYDMFVKELRDGEVSVFDVLAAARASGARGQQTFFKRDLHWTTEGAKLFHQNLADELKRIEPNLPKTEIVAERNALDYQHRGKFVSRWTYTHCGYAMPTEPQPTYTVTKRSSGGLFESSDPQVVLTGSSFSLPPYDYDFLATSLQSDVLNLSVGAGGAVVALQSYLVDGAFEAAKPKLLVWEFPTFAPAITEEEKRELLASVYGRCQNTPATAQIGEDFDDIISVNANTEGEMLNTRTGYLQIEFSDLSVLKFDLILEYDNGKKESLRVARSNLIPNRGLYFFSLNNSLGRTLQRVQLDIPRDTTGRVSVQACRRSD